MPEYTWTRHGAERAAQRWPHLSLAEIAAALQEAERLARRKGQEFLGVILPGEATLSIFVVAAGSIITGYGYDPMTDPSRPEAPDPEVQAALDI